MHQKRGTLCNCAAKIGIFWLPHKPDSLFTFNSKDYPSAEVIDLR